MSDAEELIDTIYRFINGETDWLTVASLDELLRRDIEVIEARMEARAERSAVLFAEEGSRWPYSLVSGGGKTQAEAIQRALVVLKHPDEFPAYQEVATAYLKQCRSQQGIFQRGAE